MCSAVLDKNTQTPLPTRKSVRRLRWFESSFRARMAATSAQTGISYTLNDSRLVDTFLAWHRAFDSQKPASRMVRRAYVSFAAGMMFHELLRKRPVSVKSGVARDDPTNPALFRPEEYLYASYCHIIRQAILGQDFWLDTRNPDRLDDPAAWQAFSDDLATDRAAAIDFLDRLANEHRPWTLPMMTQTGGGFGARLWSLAARQAEPEGPTDPDDVCPVSASPVPHGGHGLRLVSDRTPFRPVHLPPAARMVLIAFEGVAVRTEAIDSEELTVLLNEHNVKLTPDETRERFFGQPISAAMTYVAERTGQLCPASFIAKLDQRLINRDRRDLTVMPGLQEFLGRVAEAGLDVCLVSHGRRRRVEAAQSLPALSALRTVGSVRMLDSDSGLEAVTDSFGHSPRQAVLIDASCVGIGMARNVSMPTFGFVARHRNADRNALSCAGAQAVIGDLAALEF